MGIIRVGAFVESGDILVGKVTPKGESDQPPEEKLLRAIFGEKARDVRDNSLRVPGTERGRVVDVRIYTREQGDEIRTSTTRPRSVPGTRNELSRTSRAFSPKMARRSFSSGG